MLRQKQLRGVWVAVPSMWDEHFNFDEESFRQATAMLRDAGVHGIYTTGTTGEFYAFDFEEYKLLVDAFAAETVGKIPCQVGATWFNTRDVIRRVRYARDRGIDGAQLALPSWGPLSDADIMGFFNQIASAVPDMPLIHYNTASSKRVLMGNDYQHILPVCPNLVGTKVAAGLEVFMDVQIKAPELAHFVADIPLVMGVLFGAKGTYSAYALMNPRVMLDYYDLCLQGRWEEAVGTQKRIITWRNATIVPLRAKGYDSPSIDRALTEMAGWLPCRRIPRPPYHPIRDDDMSELRRATEKLFPEFLSYQV